MKQKWLIAVILGVGSICHPVQASVVAPDAVVGGKTIGEWSAEWWRWGFSFQAGAGPLDDTTGEFGYLGDIGGPVFLLGASGGVPVNWTMTVPEGQYILFPLLTALDWVGDGRTEGEVLLDVQTLTDGATGLYATVDGVPLTTLALHRALSPWFDFPVPAGGLLDEGSYHAIADGYWLMLEPLSAGSHTFSFGGALPEYEFAADTNVAVTVTPEPASAVMFAVGLGGLFAWRRKQRR